MVHGVRPSNVTSDMVTESLQTLWPVTAILAWLWTAGVMLTAERQTIPAWVALALLLVTIGVSHWLAPGRLWAAIAVYVAGLTAAITIFTTALGAAGLLYLYSLVVLIVALLMGDRATWYAALGCTALILVVGTRALGLAWPMLTEQIALLWLTAFTAWLGSRRLLTALAWTLNMTREAQRNAQEAQDSRAQAQLALKSLDEAYVRLERTTEALMFAREAAEKAYRFKADFVANVSHELRTPLNLIIGFSEMMVMAPESYGGVGLPSPYRGDMMAIYRSAKHLSDLINDVLDLSQIEAGRMPMHREPADLAQIVREAADIVRGWAEARQLRLMVEIADALPVLRLDRTRIRQVLLNLLTNATRFTTAGWIRVQAHVVDRDAIVEVQDSGPGIPHENLSMAFEAFGQMGSDHAREGSGLGLAISHKFVELHGGRMWIHSEEGHGTTVGFAIPLPDGDRDVPPPALVRSPTTQGTPDRPAAVICHKDARLQSLFERYVDGYQFIQVSDAAAADRMVRESDAVALIHDATGADGNEAPAGNLPGNLPTHVTSIECPLPSLRRLGSALGATDFLAKPVTRDRLLHAVAQLAAPPKSVLIVDDDPDVVRLLSRILRTELPSCQVFEVFNGEKALEIARSRRPDLILLDLLMPGFSGYDLLRAQAEDPDLAGTPVIIISARSLEQESAHIGGEVRIKRAAGFTATEMVQLVGATLSALTQSSPSLATIDPPLPGTRPG